MDKIKKSIKLPSFPIDNLEYIDCLVYCDRPILSRYKTNLGDSYLFFLVDFDTTFERVLIFKCEEGDIEMHNNDILGLCNLIMETPDSFVYKVDIDHHGNYHDVEKVLIHNIPVCYLPDDFKED